MSFFSVIITTFNRGNLLMRAVDSLLLQEESDWECIIVDDGSEDNTGLILKPLIEKYKNFKYIFQKNHGQGYSRNVGLRNGAGKYATFLDSDDEYKPGHLKRRKEILIQNPWIQLLHGGVEIIGNPYVPDKTNPQNKIHLDNCVIGGTFFINREDAISLGGFPEIRYSDDAAFFEKAGSAGWKILKTGLPTYIYHRDTPDSICNNLGV